MINIGKIRETIIFNIMIFIVVLIVSSGIINSVSGTLQLNQSEINIITINKEFSIPSFFDMGKHLIYVYIRISE